MTARRFVLVSGVVLGLVVAVGAGPAAASQGGVYLRTGDRVCTDQTRSDVGVRIFATVTNGVGTVSVRTASTAGGAETVLWSATGTTGVDRHVHGTRPGTFYRGCVTITTHTISTWTKQFILGLGAGSVSDIGPNKATLSPGAWSCGDAGLGPVRLTGTASGQATWYINAFDNDYAWVGAVFSTEGSSVDTVFTPPPDLSLLEMCVRNLSQSRIDTSFELSAA